MTKYIWETQYLDRYEKVGLLTILEMIKWYIYLNIWCCICVAPGQCDKIKSFYQTQRLNEYLGEVRLKINSKNTSGFDTVEIVKKETQKFRFQEDKMGGLMTKEVW